MADGLSVAASVAGLITLADVVVRKGYKYVKAVKDSEKSLKALLNEVNKLSGILHSLKNVVDRLECDDVKLDPTTQIHYVEECYQTLQKVQRHLEEADPAAAKSSYDAKILKLRWPMTSSRIKSLFEEVKKHITVMTLALNADEMSALLVLLARQEDIDVSLKTIEGGLVSDRVQRKEIEINERQKDMLSFLSYQNARARLDSNIRLKQPGTGIWFIDGLEFKNWLVEDRSRLWVHGIPGAGKTILTSLAIIEAQKRTNESTALAYFFCDYKDSATHDPVQILGTLAKQIAIQHEGCFTPLEKLYQSYRTKDRVVGQPSTEELCELLQQMSRNFKRVMVIVDGLDEISKNRSDVTDMLQSLNTPTGTIKTLFSSRREFDLEHPLRDYIEISIAAMGSDLRLYVAAEIENRTQSRKLRIQDPDLKEHIMKTLIDGAEGMFRWVACQMDYLCQCNSDRDRREALKQLPPDLPSSYERILARVNQSSKKNQRLVIRTLTWLLYANEILDTNDLLQALAVEEGESNFDKSALSTEDDLMHWCSSLIRRTTLRDLSPGLEFAHFTVKEYLLTLRDLDNMELSKYCLSKQNADIMLGRTCLTFVNYHIFGTVKAPDSVDDFDILIPVFENYNFLVYAASFWESHALPHMDDEIISQLVGKLLAPVASNQFRFWTSIRTFTYEQWKREEYDELFPNNNTLHMEPLHWAVCFGLEDVCKRLLVHGMDVNSEIYFGHLLNCAILGIKMRDRYWAEMEALVECSLETENYHCNRASIVKLLLLAGADPKKKDRFERSELPPLSVALRCELEKQPKVFLTLTEYGAGTTLTTEDIQCVIDHDPGECGEMIEALYACATRGLLQPDTRESVFKLALWDFSDDRVRSSRLKALDFTGILSKAAYESMLDNLEDCIEFDSLEALKIISKVILNGDQEANSTRKFLKRLVLRFIEIRGVDELDDLLEEDFLFSCKDNDGNTLLHLALLEAQEEDYDGKDDSDETEDYSDDTEGSDEDTSIILLTEFLLKREGFVEIKNYLGETALHLAAQQRSVRLFEVVCDATNSPASLTSPTNEGRTPLWYAINSQSELIVEFLIEKLDQLNLDLDQDGDLLLYGLTPIMTAAKIHKWRVVRRLIGSASYHNILLPQVAQLFLYAAQDGVTEILKHLVDEFPGLDIETRDENGATPLLLAAQGSRNLSAFEYLIVLGANLNAKCDSGTIAHFAVSSGGNAIRDQLLSLGISWNTQGRYATSGRPDHGSPLHKAAAVGAVSAIEFLLGKKLIDPNLESTAGLTPLAIAVQLDQCDAARALLENGSSVDNRNANGKTSLHLAAGLGYEKIAETLLEHGSDPSIKDLEGFTPKDCALERKHAEVADLIQSAIDKKASIAYLNTLLDKQDRPNNTFTFHSNQQMASKIGESGNGTSLPLQICSQRRNIRAGSRASNRPTYKSAESTSTAINSPATEPEHRKSIEPTIFRIHEISSEIAAKCYSRLANRTSADQKKSRKRKGDIPAFLIWKPEENFQDEQNIQETPFLMLYKDLEPVLGGVVRAATLD